MDWTCFSSSNVGQSMMVASPQSVTVDHVSLSETLGTGWGPGLVDAKSYGNLGFELQKWLTAG